MSNVYRLLQRLDVSSLVNVPLHVPVTNSLRTSEGFSQFFHQMLFLMCGCSVFSEDDFKTDAFFGATFTYC